MDGDYYKVNYSETKSLCDLDYECYFNWFLSVLIKYTVDVKSVGTQTFQVKV